MPRTRLIQRDSSDALKGQKVPKPLAHDFLHGVVSRRRLISTLGTRKSRRTGAPWNLWEVRARNEFFSGLSFRSFFCIAVQRDPTSQGWPE